MEALGLNLADWFILIVLIASGIIAFARGFTKEFLSLFLWIAAFIAAISLEYLATPKINEFIGNEEISKIISYIVVFIIFIFIGGIVIKFISKLIKWSGASGFDRFLGVLFGLIRGLIVLFVIFLLLPCVFTTSACCNFLLNNLGFFPVKEFIFVIISVKFWGLLEQILKISFLKYFLEKINLEITLQASNIYVKSRVCFPKLFK